MNLIGRAVFSLNSGPAAVPATSSLENDPVKDPQSEEQTPTKSPSSLIFLSSEFKLEEQEEILLKEIIHRSKLTPNLTLFDLLFFNLHRELTSLQKCVQEEVFVRETNELEECYANLVLDETKATAQLSQFLIGVIAQFIRSNHALNFSTAVTARSVEAQGETKHITRTLFHRVQLFKKLINHPDCHQQLFYHPLKTLIGSEKFDTSDHIELKEIFANNSRFLKIVCNYLRRMYPEINESPQLIEKLIKDVKSRGDLNKSLFLKSFDLDSTERLLSFSSHLSKIFKDSFVAFNQITQEAKAFFKSTQSEKVDLAFQTGNPPTLSEESSLPLDKTDILAKFRLKKLVEDSFKLTQDESNLIRELFKYPLDSDMTMFDILGFALSYDKLENLKVINVRFNEIITETQGKLSVYCLGLFIGFNRSSPDIIDSIGPINLFSEEYIIFPHTFPIWVNKCLKEFEEAIEKIEPPKFKRQFKEFKRQKKAILKQFTLTVFPLRDLFFKLLQSKDSRVLLLRAASTYQDYETLDEKHPAAQAVIERYWDYFRTGDQIGRKMKLLPMKLPVDLFNGNTLPFSTPPLEKEMASFGFKIAKTIHYLYTMKFDFRDELLEAMDGKLDHQTWLKRKKLPQVKAKNPQEFKEFLLSLMTLTHGSFLFLSDMLRLIEKRVYPEGTLTTQSCFFRLRHNIVMNNKKPIDSTSSCLLPSAIPLKFNKIVDRIRAELKQHPELFNYALAAEDIQNGNFIHGKWLEFLIPMEVAPKGISITSLLESSLSSLMTLKEEIIQDLKKEWSTLTLEELKKLDIAATKEAIFQEGLKLLRPLLILVDMLALLQKRHFSEEAAIIPKELAEIMELDEIEEMLNGLIQTKTPPQPPPIQEQFLPAPSEMVSGKEANSNQEIQQKKVTEEIKPEPFPVNKGKIPAVQRASPKKGPSRIRHEEAAPQTPMPAMPEEIRELADLTKSRKILAKLKKMNFIVDHQTGSHQVLKSLQGGTVVVPNNDELPEGTRRSISEQAAKALSTTRK